MSKILLGAVFLAAITACGGTPAAPSRPVPPTNVPVQACLQLQNFGLHNHGQGISAAFRRQLEQETTGSAMYADTVQWLNDLAAPIPTASGDVVTRIQQVLTDAHAVGADCLNYGVRNVLGS